MAQIPLEHIVDSHKLTADGMIELWELTPSGGGGGTVRFKAGNDVTWRTFFYKGLPVTATGEKKTTDSGLSMPKLVIGEPNVDLSQLKGLVFDGNLDNATVVRITILLDNLLNNRLIRETQVFRVKRVEEYSRSRISMQLATTSDSLGFSLPFRQYNPPAFPSVQM